MLDEDDWLRNLRAANGRKVSDARREQASFLNTMSDNKKQEKDFTPEVTALIPEAESLVKVQASFRPSSAC